MQIGQRQHVLLFLIFSSLILNFKLAAQTAKIDSLKKAQKNNSYCTKAWLETQILLANKTIYYDISLAKQQIDSVLLAPSKCLDLLPKSFSRHLLIKSWTFQGVGQLDSAIVYALAARSRAAQGGTQDELWEITINLASMLVQSDYPSTADSLEVWQKGIQKLEGEYKLKSYLAMIHANYYESSTNYEKAFRILNDALLSMPEANLEELEPILGEISKISHHTNNFSAAISMGKQILKTSSLNPYHRHVTRDQVGASYLMVGLPDSALVYLRPNLKTKAPSLVRLTHSFLSDAYVQLRNDSMAMHHIKIADSLYTATQTLGGHKYVLIKRAILEDKQGLTKERNITLARHDSAKDNLDLAKLTYQLNRTKFTIKDLRFNT